MKDINLTANPLAAHLKPVAWRRMNPDCSQSTGVTDVEWYAEGWRHSGAIVQPLYAAACAEPKETAVLLKELRDYDKDGSTRFRGKTLTENAADMIEDQAFTLAQIREALRRIADDYHPEKGQEALALSEMREAIATLAAAGSHEDHRRPKND